jgi:hypothetical protein
VDREQIHQLRQDLDIIQKAAGLSREPSRFNGRLFGYSLAALGIVFFLIGLKNSEWVVCCVFIVITAFLGLTYYLVRSGRPNFAKGEMVQLFSWLGALFAVSLIFAIWGVSLGLPTRVIVGAEMFISGIFPLPVSIVGRASKLWVCGIPLMAAGLAMPFVTVPMGAMTGLGVVLGGLAYVLTQKLSSPKTA